VLGISTVLFRWMHPLLSLFHS